MSRPDLFLILRYLTIFIYTLLKLLTSFIYRIAVNGKLNEQNNKSEKQSDSTNAVVACPRNLGFRMSAIIVNKFPACYIGQI